MGLRLCLWFKDLNIVGCIEFSGFFGKFPSEFTSGLEWNENGAEERKRNLASKWLLKQDENDLKCEHILCIIMLRNVCCWVNDLHYRNYVLHNIFTALYIFTHILMCIYIHIYVYIHNLHNICSCLHK